MNYMQLHKTMLNIAKKKTGIRKKTGASGRTGSLPIRKTAEIRKTQVKAARADRSARKARPVAGETVDPDVTKTRKAKAGR